LTALNDQNIEGTCEFLSEVGILEIPSPSLDADSRPEQAGPRLGAKACLVVASLVPTGEIEKKRVRLGKLEERIGEAVVKLSYHPQLALERGNHLGNCRDARHPPGDTESDGSFRSTSAIAKSSCTIPGGRASRRASLPGGSDGASPSQDHESPFRCLTQPEEPVQKDQIWPRPSGGGVDLADDGERPFISRQ
jgi:hypothetical protein